MKFSRTVSSVVTAVLLLAVVAGIWFLRPDAHSTVPPAGSATRRPPAPPDDAADYVGSAACAACHVEQSRQYDTHPMAHSTVAVAQLGAEEIDLAREARFAHDGLEYLVETRDGAMRHHERLFDRQGKLVTDQWVDVGFAIGSGIRGRSFAAFRDGLLFQSPVSWFTQEQRWDLSPGYAPQRETRFERRIGDDCLACHVGQIRHAPSRQADRYLDPPFTEASIGCERCHGPGRRHVELYESDAPDKGADPYIVNPARLDPWKRDSICWQCHFSGVKTLRFGRGHLDFRPGMGFDEIWTALVHVEETERGSSGKAVSHVHEMVASRCYEQSQGRLGCTSCHDAHSVPTVHQRDAWYRARCQACHEQRGCSLPEPERRAQANSCIACHMPRRAAGNIAHTSQTEHRVLRRPAAVQPSAARGDPGTLVLFEPTDRALEPWERTRAIALAMVDETAKFYRQEPGLTLRAKGPLEEANAANPGDFPVVLALGMIHHLAQEHEQARRYCQEALGLQPDHEEALRLLSVSCFLLGDYQAGLASMGRFLELNPWHAEMHARYAAMQAAMGDLPGALASARRGLELAPTLVPLRIDLVRYLEQAGQIEQAREQRQLAVRIQQLVE